MKAKDLRSIADATITAKQRSTAAKFQKAVSKAGKPAKELADKRLLRIRDSMREAAYAGAHSVHVTLGSCGSNEGAEALVERQCASMLRVRLEDELVAEGFVVNFGGRSRAHEHDNEGFPVPYVDESWSEYADISW